MASVRTKVPLCHDILGLSTTTVPIPDFQLLNDIEDDVSGFEDCELKVKYTVEEIDNSSILEKGLKIDHDHITYKKSIGIFGDLECVVYIGENTLELKVNKKYHQLGRMSIDSVPSVGSLLEDLISVFLLSNGYALLYCAGFTHNGSTSVLIGVANTGKTTTTLEIIKNYGARYISEDIAITDGSNLYCCPYALSHIDQELIQTNNSHYLEKVSTLIPLIDRVRSRPVNSVYDILDDDQINHIGEVDNICILSRGGKRVQNVDPAQMIAVSNRSEFRYSTNQLLLSAQYLGYELDLDAAMQTEMEILRKLTSKNNIFYFYGKPDELSEQVYDIIRD